MTKLIRKDFSVNRITGGSIPFAPQIRVFYAPEDGPAYDPEDIPDEIVYGKGVLDGSSEIPPLLSEIPPLNYAFLPSERSGISTGEGEVFAYIFSFSGWLALSRDGAFFTVIQQGETPPEPSKDRYYLVFDGDTPLEAFIAVPVGSEEYEWENLLDQNYEFEAHVYTYNESADTWSFNATFYDPFPIKDERVAAAKPDQSSNHVLRIFNEETFTAEGLLFSVTSDNEKVQPASVFSTEIKFKANEFDDDGLTTLFVVPVGRTNAPSVFMIDEGDIVMPWMFFKFGGAWYTDVNEMGLPIEITPLSSGGWNHLKWTLYLNPEESVDGDEGDLFLVLEARGETTPNVWGDWQQVLGMNLSAMMGDSEFIDAILDTEIPNIYGFGVFGLLDFEEYTDPIQDLDILIDDFRVTEPNRSTSTALVPLVQP